jgi:hypothetical protein
VDTEGPLNITLNCKDFIRRKAVFEDMKREQSSAHALVIPWKERGWD